MSERERIDQENRQRIAQMSPEEIAHERRELMAGLNPSLIERLLRRANIDDDNTTSDETLPLSESAAPAEAQSPGKENGKPKKSVSFEPAGDVERAKAMRSSPPQVPEPNPKPDQPFRNPDGAPSILPSDLGPASEAPFPIHFPQPPTAGLAPDLDPSSPNFLEDLRSHYFPSLPSSTENLSWLKPPSDAETEASPYNPSQDSLSPAELRFSFTGTLVPPSAALAMPVTMGLHHHASAPESAGYTIPELAQLARSTYAAQRCIAWQVLGRIFYRLGKEEWGQEISNGVWDVVEREGVVGGMMAEANQPEGRGHTSAKAWATEGLWLWRLGGGKRGIGPEKKAT